MERDRDVASSLGGAGTSNSIAKSELIGRSITSILGSSTEISGGAGAGPSTSALPPMQQVPLVNRRKRRRRKKTKRDKEEKSA